MGYKHFMLKEINEQPDVIRNFLSGKLHSANEPIILDEVKLDKSKLKNFALVLPLSIDSFINSLRLFILFYSFIYFKKTI